MSQLNDPQVLAECITILERLVGFETMPGETNLALIDYVSDHLKQLGLDCVLSHDETGLRANLYCQIGPSVEGGVVLNGHTDVVPVTGQNWSCNPFKLTRDDNRLYGRGAVDMKGFLAAMLAMAPYFQQKPLARPIFLSVCFDEEIGGFGAPILAQSLLDTAPTPTVAIIGEPTMMNIISGHKGGYEMQTVFSGIPGHASDPRRGVNAIHYAAKFIAKLDDIAIRLAENPQQNSPYDPPYTTINTGVIKGGAARNIIAGDCVVDWELRPVPGDDHQALMAEISNYTFDELLPDMQKRNTAAKIDMIEQAWVPPLDEKLAQQAVELITAITGKNQCDVVAFGTDAGHFCNAGISTVVFGPGNIEQAHQPDEFIEVEQLAKCLSFLAQLGDHMANHHT